MSDDEFRIGHWFDKWTVERWNKRTKVWDVIEDFPTKREADAYVDTACVCVMVDDTGQDADDAVGHEPIVRWPPTKDIMPPCLICGILVKAVDDKWVHATIELDIGECRFCGARATPPLRIGEVCGGCGNEAVPGQFDGRDDAPQG